MPNIKSAEKSLRQTKKRTARNAARKDAYRRAIKHTVKALDGGTREDALKFAREAQKALGKAAKVGVLKKKAAARKLSRLMKRVNAAAR
ncbi:MAG: 30S ribosomal protein S20 [Patescibacteria group bacterium]